MYDHINKSSRFPAESVKCYLKTLQTETKDNAEGFISSSHKITKELISVNITLKSLCTSHWDECNHGRHYEGGELGAHLLGHRVLSLSLSLFCSPSAKPVMVMHEWLKPSLLTVVTCEW